ncbi:ribonuclease H-like domain-containing protein, partial [Tanacetum coccineum]
MPTSIHSDFDESQMTYGKNSNDQSETDSNDFVSCASSDKSSEPKTNDFASCDSSDKSSSPKSVESSVFSPRVAESESNLKTAAQEDISFNNNTPSVSSVKDDKHSSFGCNKNGLRHCVKNKVSGSKSCFVCGSFSHLIKDCDFYENKMGVYSVQRESRPMWNNVDNIPPFIPQAAHGRSGNVTFPAGSVNVPAPIPAGRQTGPAPVYAGTPVPAGRQNRPAPVHADRPFPAGRRNSVSVSAGWRNNAARPMSRPTSSYFQNYSRPVYYDQMYMGEGRWGTAENPLKNKDLGIVDSGCSRSMSGNKERLDDFVEIKGGTVTFGGGEGRITGKGTIRTSKLDFENVYYVKELQNFNLFSVSQICDKKNNVLFTETECLVLSKDFKLPDNSQVVLRVPRRHNLYSFNMNELQPEGTLTCLVAKASLDESTKWHRRMAHVNFKNINKLAENGLVKGLPSKIFSNEHNYVACNKGKQHKASYKAITAIYDSKPLWLPLPLRLVAERKNRTLIEAARTMLADSKLPTMFWTEAVSTACYVLNRVLVTSPHNKTPYELLSGKVPNISHFKPFGCQVTILNTSDHLGKFEGKADEGFIVGYAANSKAYRVYNLSSKKVEETLNLRYLEDKPNIQGAQDTHINAGTQDDDSDSDGYAEELTMLQRQEHEAKDAAEQFGFEFTTDTEELLRQATIEARRNLDPAGSVPVPTGSEPVSCAHTPLSSCSLTRYPTHLTFGNSFSSSSELEDIHHHPSIGIFSSSSYDDDFGADANNLAPTVDVNSLVTKRVNTIHPQSLILGDPTLAVQTRSKVQKSQFGESAFLKLLKIPGFLVDAMQEECNKFLYQKLWKLVPFARRETLKGQNGSKVQEGCHRVPFSTWKIEEEFTVTQTKDLWTPQNPSWLQGLTGIVWTIHQAQLRAMVKQQPDGIFIHQEKYVHDILKKFDLETAGTQDPAGVTISSSVAATRTPDVSAKSSSTSPLPASFSAASTTPPSTNLSPPPPTAVTDTTTTSLPAEPNPANPVGAVPTDETQDVSTPAAQTISSPSSTGTPKRRKRTAKKHAPKPLLDMDDQSFIKFDSGSESDSDLVPWAAIAAWEVLSTPLGEINALYRIDGVTKHFTTLREILHMVDRQDLMKLYGIVDKFYQTTVATGVGLILWGDLKVLLDSMEGGAGYSIWGSQQNWQVRCWRLYTFSNVYALETMAGIVLYMFVDVPYPLSIKLMERMLIHKLELARDVVGNDLTTLKQLIGFIKNQLADAQFKEYGALESASVYVLSLHSQHHAHMCFCCFLMLVNCFAAVPISIPSGRILIVLAGRSTKSFFSGMMVSLIFFEGLDDEAWVKAMEEQEEEEDDDDDDDKENEDGDHLIKMRWINV